MDRRALGRDEVGAVNGEERLSPALRAAAMETFGAPITDTTPCTAASPLLVTRPALFFACAEKKDDLRVRTLARLSGLETREIRRGAGYLATFSTFVSFVAAVVASASFVVVLSGAEPTSPAKPAAVASTTRESGAAGSTATST